MRFAGERAVVVPALGVTGVPRAPGKRKRALDEPRAADAEPARLEVGLPELAEVAAPILLADGLEPGVLREQRVVDHHGVIALLGVLKRHPRHERQIDELQRRAHGVTGDKRSVFRAVRHHRPPRPEARGHVLAGAEDPVEAEVVLGVGVGRKHGQRRLCLRVHQVLDEGGRVVGALDQHGDGAQAANEAIDVPGAGGAVMLDGEVEDARIGGGGLDRLALGRRIDDRVIRIRDRQIRAEFDDARHAACHVGIVDGLGAAPLRHAYFRYLRA